MMQAISKYMIIPSSAGSQETYQAMTIGPAARTLMGGAKRETKNRQVTPERMLFNTNACCLTPSNAWAACAKGAQPFTFTFPRCGRRIGVVYNL